MAAPAAVARMRSVLHDNFVAARWLDKIVESADGLLPAPPSVGPATLDIARQFVLRIETLGIVWFATGDPRYRDRARQELLAMCGLPDWGGNEFLVTAETVFGAAIGYDWLFDGLSPGEREAVAAAILTKGIAAGLSEFDHDDSAPHWTTSRTNWNLVCNGALMVAALAVAEADPEATGRLFELCRRSIAIGFSLYGPDGGWVEGPGYWHYATEYAVYLLDSLATALGEDFGLGASPGFGETGIFRLHAAGPSGKFFNFADSEEEHSGGYWLFWLAKRYHHPVDAWIERHHRKIHPMDLLWFDPRVRSATSERVSRYHRFQAIDTAMLRGGWRNLQATYLGVKGGANDAARHVHYDLGSFVLDCGGLRWAVDLGPDDYNLPGYFDAAMRSRYYRTGTLGHNTIVVNWQSQPPTARAPIIRTQFKPGLSCIVLDMSEANPGLARARRGFVLIAGSHVAIVDEIVPEAPLASVVWQMHTEAAIDLQGAAATLTQSAADTEPPARFFARIIEPAGLVFARADAAPGDPPGQKPNIGIAKLLVDLAPVEGPLRLAVFLSPVEGEFVDPEWEAFIRRPLDEWGEAPRR